MARKVNRFEDLVAWQRARAFAKDVILTTRQGGLARDFSLRDQMVRAARADEAARVIEGLRAAVARRIAATT